MVRLRYALCHAQPHFGRGTSAKNKLRCKAGAKVILGGELNSRDRFEDRALPGGLISANDELGQCDAVTDTLGSKEIDHVKQLAVVFGLQRWKHFDVPTTAHSFCPSE